MGADDRSVGDEDFFAAYLALGFAFDLCRSLEAQLAGDPGSLADLGFE